MNPVDGVDERLVRLAEQLRHTLGARAAVSVDDAGPYVAAWSLAPANPEALPVVWMDFGEELQVEAGHHGGRWELGRTMEDVEFVEHVVQSVVAGRVVEVFGPGRSRVEVTFADGTKTVETGAVTAKGCLPIPGWVRRGRRVAYAAY